MNINGISTGYYPTGYTNNKTTKTQKVSNEKNFTNTMGNATGSKSVGFVLHTSNEEDGIAIGSSTDRNGSVTVYKPNDFDPENPVYKVKVWDTAGNVTEERMVDVSKVDPKHSDYVDMYAYSCHLTDSGECPGAQDAFMGAYMGAEANYNAGSNSSYFDKKNWVKIIKDIMQMQYDAGNLAGYARYMPLYRFIEQSNVNKESRPFKKMVSENKPAESENEFCSLCGSRLKPDGSCPICIVPTFISGNKRSFVQNVSQVNSRKLTMPSRNITQ